jgi:glutamate racemase
LRKKFKFPIIGTEPAVCTAASRGGEVFVLTTRATYESQRFKTLCDKAQKRYPRAVITPFPCDALAGEIERQIGKKDYDFTSFLPRGRPNVVVLGCTHYIYIEEAVKKFYGCEVVNGNEGVATRLISVLCKSDFLTTKGINLQVDRDGRPYLTTKNTGGRQKPIRITKKEVKRSKNMQNYDNIFFLGNAQVVNKTQYEQMFAPVYTQKEGLSGQKD